MNNRRFTYLHTPKDGIRNWINAAEAAKFLPMRYVSKLIANMSLPICIKYHDPLFAALLRSPTHVSCQAPELFVEAGGRIGSKAFKLIPYLAGTGSAILAWYTRSIWSWQSGRSLEDVTEIWSSWSSDGI
jgi:hypothetical protein